jgi:zeaxanthin glucosyltransferase
MDDIGPIPASAIVVSKAPQLELLKRAELCITHAGINTTLESLALGVPMVAIPVGFDQPGIAARIVWHGVGKSVPVAPMSEENLSAAIQEVLGNPGYRDAARRFQRTIARNNGLDRAADVLEQAFQSVDQSGETIWETSNSWVRRSNN